MIFPSVHFDELNEQHLRSLIESAVAERRTVEYKRELPGGGDEAKREFLADSSSFANAAGGDLLYGIEEQEGVPTAILPLKLNPDQETLRWEQAIRDGISPRVPGVRVRAISVSGGHVLLIRIPRSWAGPHGSPSRAASASTRGHQPGSTRSMWASCGPHISAGQLWAIRSVPSVRSDSQPLMLRMLRSRSRPARRLLSILCRIRRLAVNPRLT